MIKTLVVDDEKHARERLNQVLSKYSDVEILKLCCDGAEAIEAINSLEPDLVFLDIEMPQVDGFEVISKISTPKLPIIVFVTAFSKYAVKAFEVNAHDYIHKPVREERLQVALSKAREALNSKEQAEIQKSLEALLRERSNKEETLQRYVMKNGNTINILKMNQVQWIEASGNYIQLIHMDKKYMIRSTLSGFLEKLDHDKFFQIHKSTVINLEFVDRFEEQLYGDYKVIMKSGEKLKMSRNYSDFLKSI